MTSTKNIRSSKTRNLSCFCWVLWTAFWGYCRWRQVWLVKLQGPWSDNSPKVQDFKQRVVACHICLEKMWAELPVFYHTRHIPKKKHGFSNSRILAILYGWIQVPLYKSSGTCFDQVLVIGVCQEENRGDIKRLLQSISWICFNKLHISPHDCISKLTQPHPHQAYTLNMLHV